ncbi:MAG: HAMP domain-containing sensor histidine kinase [Pseudoxanthomonas sp.]
MARPSSLRARLLRWSLAYMAIVAAVVIVGGGVVNEHAERQVWKALMDSDLRLYVQRRQADPGYRWVDDPAERIYHLDGSERAPPSLARLAPGLHDDFPLDGHANVVLVQDTALGRLALVLDITRFAGVEGWVAGGTVAVAVLAIAVFGVLMAWGLGRAVQPLARMAAAIARLPPDARGARIEVEPDASAELQVIGAACNDYLARNARFVERERAFIDSASHELRTPLAVIAGANALALEQPGLPAEARVPLQRVRRTLREVEQLLSLLLVLAKEPARLARNAELLALDALLPDILADHAHLSAGRDLRLRLGALPPCTLQAPPAIVAAAVGNLLRNAIENSERGTVELDLQAPATVVIRDPGHAMSPEEISALYAAAARGQPRGGGIGLDLIARVCEHLGWVLSFEAAAGGGTVARLDFSSSRVGPG